MPEKAEARNREDAVVSDPDEERLPVKPIRFVERVLTRPDGSTVKVEVPVYPSYEINPVNSKTNGTAAAKASRRGGS